MTFTTLQYNGVEKALADWGISAAQREVTNQAHDHMAFNFMLAADANDPIPYGGQIIIRIGRVSSTPIPASGLPPAGASGFSGGATWFVGWRVENFRTGNPALESMDLKFAGPWEYFFERLVFQKLWMTWNGSENVADYRSQIVLGLSVNALVGVNDTIPGTNATNLMSIRQQVAEIIAYCAAQTTTDYGSPQIQSDALAADENGNYQLTNTYPGASFGAANLTIPDFIAGAYSASGQSSASQAQSGSTPALMTTVLRAPLDAVNDITCAEALRHMLKWIGPMGDAVVWFDYTTTDGPNPCPTLHISTRDQLPSANIPFIPSNPIAGGNAGLKIKKRDDLIPNCVALKFRISGVSGGNSYVTVINDIAGNVSGTVYEGIGQTGALYSLGTFAGGSPALLSGPTITALQNAARDFAAPTATINMEGPSSGLARCSIKCMSADFNDPSTDSTAKAMWYKLFPEFNSLTTTPTLFSADSVTITVDDPGGADDGNTGTLSAGIVTINDVTYNYLLTDGQVAPWMLSGNTPTGAPVSVLQATVNAKFVITKTAHSGGTSVPVGNTPYAEKTARVTLVTIPGGNYQVQTSFSAGEVVPYGLAGYIYAIAQIPQYEGQITIQETEVTDPCPMGHNLNISGGRAEWASMAACVQSISYDLTAGKTTFAFGPAAHLGARDLVERLRANRYPIRPFYGIGGNVTNSPNAQSGAQLGNSVTQRGPSPGLSLDSHTYMPLDPTLADLSHTYTYGAPGAHFDTRATGTPNYGNISGLSAPSTPGFFFAEGSGGTLGRCIRAFTGDLPSGAQAYFQAVQVCINLSGQPTLVTGYFLCYIPTS